MKKPKKQTRINRIFCVFFFIWKTKIYTYYIPLYIHICTVGLFDVFDVFDLLDPMDPLDSFQSITIVPFGW